MQLFDDRKNVSSSGVQDKQSSNCAMGQPGHSQGGLGVRKNHPLWKKVHNFSKKVHNFSIQVQIFSSKSPLAPV